MKTLSTYLTESLQNILEGNAAKETLIQETLTCFFFDAWFNLHETFDNNEELADYYKEHTDVISQIASIVGLSLDDYDKFLLVQNKSGRYTPVARDWQNSFIYQCESFEKWIGNHPSFSHNLTFVHHDSKIGVKCGGISKNWSIAQRVDVGTKKYHFGDKDKYQKADIYAVVDNIDVKPEDDINDEVTYWTQSIEGKESDTFVGISLKKLGKTLSKVHTYGLDQMTLTVDEKSVKFNFDIFGNVKFDPSNGIINPGLLTSTIDFDIDTDGETHSCEFAIRANSKGPEHAMKDPHVSWSAATTAELKMTGAKAMAGKCASLVSSWIPGRVNDCKDKSSAEYMKKMNVIASNMGIAGVSFNNSMSPDAITLLDFLAENNKVISDLYKAFEKGPKTLETIRPYLVEMGIKTDDNIKDVMNMLYAATKWQNIAWRILCMIEAISIHVKNDGLNQTILQLYTTSKGISQNETDIHLPYVLIGE